MTDQYKELREYAETLSNSTWAKQALQLLDEMEAVGAGGVYGKASVALEPGVLQPLDNTAVLKSWVSLINQADDETKAILRMGLKEEIERMFSKAVDHPSAYSQNKWVGWLGGENPAPGCIVDFKLDGESRIYRSPSANVRWTLEGGGDVTSYRVVK